MKRIIAALALAVTPMVASAQNLLTNSGFETGDLFGWSLGLGSCASASVTGPSDALDGQHALAITTTSSSCTISLGQTFGPFSASGIAGGGAGFVYRITGGTLNAGVNPAWLGLTAGIGWGGCDNVVTSSSTSDIHGVSQPCDGFISTNGQLHFALSATLPAASTFYIDDAHFSANIEGTPVTLATVTPEPATFALLATGLIGLAGFARRRNV